MQPLSLLTLDVAGIKFALAEVQEVLEHAYEHLLYFHLSLNFDINRQDFNQEIADLYTGCSFQIYRTV